MTAFGGLATDGRPLVTWSIVALCVTAFVGQLASPEVTNLFAFAPFLGWSEPWRFVTAAFLHSPSMYLHILLNMVALVTLGQYLEPLLGRARFAALYLLSGIGGQVAVTLLAGRPTEVGLATGQDNAWLTGVVGASGAIFGLFGALLVFNRALGRDSSVMYGTLLINAIFGFIYPNISWQAHLGGFVTGIAAAAVIAAFRRRDQARLVWPGLFVVLVILAGIMAATYLVLPASVR